MTWVVRLFGVWALLIALGATARAQEGVWVQIEARRSLAEAEARARAYAGRLDGVAGFLLPSGWHAIVLGPFPPGAAERELARLRALREIPGDSYISDGRSFGTRFWPADGAEQVAAIAGLETLAAAPPIEPADETPAEARASERSLTRADRELLQRALKAAGFYTSTIDGSFGPGTRRAMSAWQAARGFEATGVMTTAQRQSVFSAYRAAEASLGLVQVVDRQAGIEITLPGDEVAFATYEAPFARYDGDAAQVLLISQVGDTATLRSLYDVMQTLEIVPPEGARDFGRSQFFIEGRDDRVAARVEAQLTRDGIKGFALIWPADDPLRQALALEAMQSSFTAIPDVILPDDAGDLSQQRPDLLAGLQIRQADKALSGFFVDETGAVLTAASVASCGRITVDGDTDADMAALDNDLGLALLRPVAALAPLGIGRLSAEIPRLNSEIAVVGYPYGGTLRAPTISYGTLADLRGLDGNTSVARLALTAQPSDAGGPVLNADGQVLGMLLPRDESSASLPVDVQFATDAEAIAGFLAEHGIALAPAPTDDPLPSVNIATLGADMAVLVECWP